MARGHRAMNGERVTDSVTNSPLSPLRSRAPSSNARRSWRSCSRTASRTRVFVGVIDLDELPALPPLPGGKLLIYCDPEPEQRAHEDHAAGTRVFHVPTGAAVEKRPSPASPAGCPARTRRRGTASARRSSVGGMGPAGAVRRDRRHELWRGAHALPRRARVRPRRRPVRPGTGIRSCHEGFEPTGIGAFLSVPPLPGGGASLTVNSAMTSMRFTSPSPMPIAPMGERRVLCAWAKLTHRATDAASGV